MPKINVPVLHETDTEAVIPKIKSFGEDAKWLKTHYPSVWGAVVKQYKLDCFDGVISEALFEKKLEVLLCQDDELRRN